MTAPMIGLDVRRRAALAEALPWRWLALCAVLGLAGPYVRLAKTAWQIGWMDGPAGQRMTALAWIALSAVTIAIGWVIVTAMIGAGAYWGVYWIGRCGRRMATHITRGKLAALFAIVGVGVFMYFLADLGARYRTRAQESSDRLGMAVGAMFIATGVILRIPAGEKKS